jgi:hypothetical protein
MYMISDKGMHFLDFGGLKGESTKYKIYLSADKSHKI